MKVREMLRQIAESVRRAKPHRHTEKCAAESCEEQSAKKLHDLAASLHVLEWETYGPEAARRKRRAH